MARASCGASGPSCPFANPGMPGKAVSTSVMGSRLATATPFHWEKPCARTSNPAASNAS